MRIKAWFGKFGGEWKEGRGSEGAPVVEK